MCVRNGMGGGGGGVRDGGGGAGGGGGLCVFKTVLKRLISRNDAVKKLQVAIHVHQCCRQPAPESEQEC